jgi:hypothetical protein
MIHVFKALVEGMDNFMLIKKAFAVKELIFTGANMAKYAEVRDEVS